MPFASAKCGKSKKMPKEQYLQRNGSSANFRTEISSWRQVRIPNIFAEVATCRGCNPCNYNLGHDKFSSTEQFVDPLNKDHPRFDEVKDIKLRLLDRSIQSEGKTEPKELTIGKAVEEVKLTQIFICDFFILLNI